MPSSRRMLPSALIVAVAVAGGGLIAASHLLWVDAFDRQAPLLRLSAGVREGAALAHLWLEEGITGDPSVDYERDVRAEFDAVIALVSAARTGGETRFGMIGAVESPTLRAHLAILDSKIRALREASAQRWRDAHAGGATGTPRDQEFDRAFREALDLASVVGHEINEVIAGDRKAVFAANAAMFGLFLLLLGGMHVVLARHRRALRAHAEELEHRVAERTAELEARNAELAEARDRADEANRAKSTFLATMSHEIRTPMNAIIGMSDVLSRSASNPDQARAIGIVKQSGSSLLRILDDVLDLSRIEAGRLGIEPRDFDLAATIQECVDVLRETAGAKGIGIHASVGSGLPSIVRGDPGRLRQVLLNLVGNAVKFTERGEVAIRVSAAGVAPGGAPRVRFEVRDTGIGIPPAAQAALFQPFSQVDQSRSRRFGGTGLGLAISKRLVGMMGGEIACESEPGRGSVFWFVLPLEAAPEPRPASKADRAFTPLSARPDLPVLVVEDHPVNREVQTRMLEALGRRVETAPSGEEALRAVAERAFAAILMDCEMPGMDGYAAIAEIRRREAPGCRVPIVVVTAHAMDGERERALDAGADEFLPKPVTMESLAALFGVSLPDAAAAWPRPGPDALVDVEAFDRLETLGGGDGAFVAGVVEMFARDCPARIAKMRAALERGAGAAIATEAHRLSGACRYLGAAAMVGTLEIIESGAAAVRLTGMAALLDRLGGEFSATLRLLESMSHPNRPQS